MQVPGTLVVAGDFNNNVTLNVTRGRLADLNLFGMTPEDFASDTSRATLLDALTADLVIQPGLYNFDVIRSGSRTGPDGRPWVALEFVISTCRGDIIEGLRGRKRCVGPDDSTIPTTLKHVFQTATVLGDGHYYSAVGATIDSKWSGASTDLIAAAESLRFA